MLLSVPDILAAHQDSLSKWESPSADAAAATGSPEGGAPGPETPVEHARRAEREPTSPTGLPGLVEAAHFANFMIWGLEDEARLRDAGDARIAAVKRAIDPWNQKRNDLMEAIDAAILAHFAKVDVQGAELHSETAGMIIDRLSILALKIRNVERVGMDAAAGDDQALGADCQARADVLAAQRDDLAQCLARLLEDFAAGRRYFRRYQQLKAYNDERFNPLLRAAATSRRAVND